MPNNTRLLSVALIVFGLAFCLIYPLSIVWPSGWAWREGAPASNDYFMMIVGVYATLGVFMILASRDPRGEPLADLVRGVVEHRPCARHGRGSDAQSCDGRAFTGDVPALLLAAVVLGVLMMNRSAAARPGIVA